MMRKSQAPQKPTLHFEQIPLEVVKSIVREDVSEDGVSEKGTDKPDRAVVVPLSGWKADPATGHCHAVRFYNDPDDLCAIVGGFIGEGLEQGAAALLIVTPDHAERIEACLRARAIDVDALKRLGTIVVADAGETLQRFMIDGMPDRNAFRRHIGAMLTAAGRGDEHCSVRAYGEMVDLLWKDGLESAAIRLETLWNLLASTHEFDLLCGYSMGNFYKGPAFDEIKRHHTHLVAGEVHAAVLAGTQSAAAAS